MLVICFSYPYGCMCQRLCYDVCYYAFYPWLDYYIVSDNVLNTFITMNQPGSHLVFIKNSKVPELNIEGINKYAYCNINLYIIANNLSPLETCIQFSHSIKILNYLFRKKIISIHLYNKIEKLLWITHLEIILLLYLWMKFVNS